MGGYRILFISSALLLSCALSSGQESSRVDTLAASVVTAQDNPASIHTGLVRLDRKMLSEAPAVLGSPDVIKVIQNLPGVSAGTELMSGLYVHGGDGSDNLFLLDGVPLYQVSHLGGLFSSFNTDVTDFMEFYKSGFPARYGGRLSSVLDITTSEGDRRDFGGSFSIGLLDGRIRFSGPIVKDKLTFDVAVRRSWLDAVLAPVIAIDNSGKDRQTRASYSFMDANASLTCYASPSDKVTFRFFGGTDWLDYSERRYEKFYGKDIYEGESGERLKMKWGNLAASANWRHRLNSRSVMDALAYFSRGYSNISDDVNYLDFADDVLAEASYTDRTLSHVDAYGAKFGYTLSLEHNHIKVGADYQHSRYAPLRQTSASYWNSEPSVNTDSDLLMSDELSLYAEDRMAYGSLTVDLGLRLDAYFSSGKSWFHPQPRISASYAFAPFITAKASYTSMVQYTHLLSSIFLDLPTNLWMPSTAKMKPSGSQQVALGIHSCFAGYWHVDLEGYYKTMDNSIIYSGTTSIFPPINGWEDKFASGKGRAYGAELEVGYVSEKLSATLYYTLSWSERLFADLYPDWFYDRFDNRHKLTLMATYRFNDNIDMTAAWNWHSGNRVTMPEQTLEDAVGVSLLFSSPYNAKMPDYHRLDLGCNFRRKTRRGNERIWNVSIYNVYCRMNPVMMTFSHQEDGSLAAKVYSMVPIIPSFSYTIKF